MDTAAKRRRALNFALGPAMLPVLPPVADGTLDSADMTALLGLYYAPVPPLVIPGRRAVGERAHLRARGVR